MSLLKAVLGFAAKNADDIGRVVNRADDVVGQTNLFSKAGKARNFKNPAQAAGRRPTITPVPTASPSAPGPVPMGARRSPGQMEIPGTARPFEGGAPPVRAVPTTPRPVQPAAPAPQFGPDSRALQQGPMQAGMDPGTAQSIRQLAQRASSSSGRNITPDMLTGSQGTNVLKNLDQSAIVRAGGGGGGVVRQGVSGGLRRSGAIQKAGVDDVIDATIDPVSVRVIDRGGMPRLAGAPITNSRNVAGGLKMADLSKNPGEIIFEEVSDLGRQRVSNAVTAATVGSAVLGSAGAYYGTRGSGSPTVPTSMGDATATVEQGNVSDPQTAQNPAQDFVVNPEIAAAVSSGMDTGAAQLDPVPTYEGPKVGASIQRRGDSGERGREILQQNSKSGLSKMYAEQAAAATQPGVSDATVGELQGMGVLNTPELAEWGRANPTLAYRLLQEQKARRPVMASQQSINVTGKQLMSPMGSDVGRNAVGNSQAAMAGGTAYGSDMKAATRAYESPVIQPASPGMMYQMQGRIVQ